MTRTDLRINLGDAMIQITNGSSGLVIIMGDNVEKVTRDRHGNTTIHGKPNGTPTTPRIISDKAGRLSAPSKQAGRHISLLTGPLYARLARSKGIPVYGPQHLHNGGKP